jgi:hypothetical protein
MNQRVAAEFSQWFTPADHDAPKRVSVAVEILCKRMQNPVGAECERTSSDRRRERGINHELRSRFVCNYGNSRKVGETEDGITGRLSPQ